MWLGKTDNPLSQDCYSEREWASNDQVISIRFYLMISINCCCCEWSCIKHSVGYVNVDHHWMSSLVFSSESILFEFHSCPLQSLKWLNLHSRHKWGFSLSSCAIFSYSVFHVFFLILNSLHLAAALKMTFSAIYGPKKENVLLPVMERTPYSAWGWMGTRSFRQGMFMLSIKGWAVIKTHFFLNECKLAHLLWWASCPDSSISMIDQLSSCWWLTGNGGWGTCGGRKRDERAREEKKWTETCPKWNKSDALFD